MQILQWFKSKGYLQGVFWMVLVCAVSNLNDILIKYVGTRLSGVEIAFFRFFFSTLVLLPFMLRNGMQSFKTPHPKVHFIRALLLVAAISPWCYGVAALPLTLATTISFTTPFFVLPMALIFLKEHVGWQRWVATFIGFVGITVSLNPTGGDVFNPIALLLIASTIMFASLDIINKKLLIKDEGLLPMLFFSAVGTMLLGFVPALMAWQTPTLHELFFLLLLGCGANLILFCLLKAFSATEVSALQPFRYVELVLSACFGFLIFGEIPTQYTLIGAAIIVPATLYITYFETHKKKKSQAAAADAVEGAAAA